jgi:hypothetical protein
MTRTHRLIVGAGTTLLALLPALALACPVCGGGGDSPRSQAAFFNTTILLSLLPLGMIGGGVWWLRGKALDGEFEERDPLAPPTEDDEGETRG